MTKAVDAFRTISEVAELLDTPTHVLRFWESRFTQIKPLKRAGGRRYYRPGDVALLGGIKVLLHNEGMTIRGVQKILREQGVSTVAALSPVILAPLPSGGSHPVDLTAEDDTQPSAIARVLPFPKADQPVPPMVTNTATDGAVDGAANGAADIPEDVPEAPMAIDVPIEDPVAEIMAFPAAPPPHRPEAKPALPWSVEMQKKLFHLDTAALSTVERVRLLALNDRLLRLRARLAAAPTPSRH